MLSRRPPDVSYLSNIVLADNTLAKIQSKMKDAGLWDESIVVVTSDHGWKIFPGNKTDAGSIPLMIKLNTQDHGIRIADHFDSVYLYDLLLALLDGRLSTTHEVASWVEEKDSATN